MIWFILSIEKMRNLPEPKIFVKKKRLLGWAKIQPKNKINKFENRQQKAPIHLMF